MNIKLTIELCAFSISIIFLIIFLIKQKKISVKYSLAWFVSALILLIFGVVPNLINYLTHMLGFQMTSNLILSILIGILLMISISLTMIVSEQNEKIRLLIQEVSLLKGEK